MKDTWEALPPWLQTLDSDIYKENDYVVLDFETTNINKGDCYAADNRIILAVWTVVKGDSVKTKIKWGSEMELGELVEDIEQAKFLVAHNAKFELGWLVRCGLDLKNTLVFCTMLAEYVLRGNRVHWLLNLDACAARRRLGGKESLVSKMIKKGVCPSEIHKPWLEKYCVVDVQVCHRVFLSQIKLLTRLNMLPVTLCRNLMTIPLVGLESKGAILDEERVSELHATTLARKTELEKDFAILTEGINLKSAPQVREFIYEKLKFAVPKDYHAHVRSRRAAPAPGPVSRFPA